MRLPARAELLSQRGAVWRRAAFFALLCAALAALASSDALHAALLEVLSASEETIAHRPVWGALLFTALAAVSATFAFVSIAVLAPVAVYTWGVAASISLLLAGWIIGGVFSYAIGRLLGRPVIHWLVGRAPVRGLESRLQRDGSFGLILLLQLALPSEIPGYLLGSLRYRFSRYLLALALAELPYSVATVYLGAGFIERRTGLLLVVGALVVALSVGASWQLRARFAARRPQGDGAS
jgi:uncharacterized membrane protein YdjX (TVP38/TMEM64 family)